VNLGEDARVAHGASLPAPRGTADSPRPHGVLGVSVDTAAAEAWLLRSCPPLRRNRCREDTLDLVLPRNEARSLRLDRAARLRRSDVDAGDWRCDAPAGTSKPSWLLIPFLLRRIARGAAVAGQAAPRAAGGRARDQTPPSRRPSAL
jgi:hypothetical protein